MIPNDYPGKCFRCGGRVAAGAGLLVSHQITEFGCPGRTVGKSHYVEHPECSVKYKGTKVHWLWNPDPDSEASEHAD